MRQLTGSLCRVHLASRLRWLVAGALLVPLAAGCGSHSSSGSGAPPSGEQSAYRLSGKLDNAQSVPKPTVTKPSTGTFSGKITISGGQGTITWQMNLAGLKKATGAQLYFGRPGKIGVGAVDICKPCGPKNKGTLGANAALLDEIVSRPLYVSVWTKRNPKGELRGRVIVKPSKS